MPKLKRINLSDDLFTDLKDSNKLSGYTIDEFQLQSDSNYNEYKTKTLEYRAKKEQIESATIENDLINNIEELK